jgi:hypothetical protein
MLSTGSDARSLPARVQTRVILSEPQPGLRSHMRNWGSASLDGPVHTTPFDRYEAARAAAENVGSRLAALVAEARAKGFDSRELLGVPAIRQEARAARRAVDELHASRLLLAS